MSVKIHYGGYEEWHHDGNLHRDDGPAAIWPDGVMMWYKHGKKHRIDGPATIWGDGRKAWWVNDVLVHTPKLFQKFANLTDEEMTFILLKYGW